jgi:phospholipase/lecithinase/hemolysin
LFIRFRFLAGCFFIFCSFVPSAFSASVTQYTELVAFGDSLSDTGNVSIATNGAFPGSNYAPGRFTDGPNTTPATTGPTGVWVEQLADKLGVADPQPFLAGAGGTNYAFGSAMTGSNGFYDITDQVNYYLAQHLLGGASSTALYTIWGGANDFFSGNNTADTAASVADNLYKNIQTLAGKGAKDFLWVNLPPLDLAPGGASAGGDLAAKVKNFNQEWAVDIAKLQGEGVNVIGVDVFNLFAQIAQNPGAYGFTNIKNSAQGLSGVNPNNYLFWDTVHPTTAGHAAVADLAYNDLTASPVPEPMSLTVSALGLGALWMAARVRRSRRSADLRLRS